VTNDYDTVIFVNELKYDLHSHTVVCDAFVLPLTVSLSKRAERVFAKLEHEGNMHNVKIFPGEMESWKQLLPALVERCRSNWTHAHNCEYISAATIPLTETMDRDPLCSCGRGKDVEPMHKVALWSPFAPLVTRIAISPLFAVSYLETVGRDLENSRCSRCRKKGKPKLQRCTVCKKQRYCSEACQKKDWKDHKLLCKPAKA